MFGFFEKSDSQIQKDVMSELRWDPSVTPFRISVTANDGIVTLRGSVPHYHEKATAEQAAQRIKGVRAVADEIKVDLLGSYERSDEDIARAALSALEWNYQVPDGIKLVVEDGWVTLSGEAEWDYQRNAAKDAVSPLMGVCGVSNKISLKSKVQASDVKTSIRDALKRSAESEGRHITIAVDGTRVTLSGTVQSAAEVEDAVLAAWNAPGVMMVDNRLTFQH